MKLLFNLEVLEGNRVSARPSDYLQSLPHDRQIEEVTEFLRWAEQEAANGTDPQARAEAEIGVATARQFLAKLDHVAGQVIVERPGHVGHTKGDAEFARVLAGCCGAIVQGQHLRYIAMQNRRGAGADFFRDGEKRVAVDGQQDLVVDDRLDGAHQDRSTRFVIQVTRNDVAVFKHLGLWIHGDKVADVNPQAHQVLE